MKLKSNIISLGYCCNFIMSSYSNLYKYVECCDGCGATGATCASQQALITSLTTRIAALETTKIIKH